MERGLALLGLGLALLLLAPSRRLASAAPVEDGMLALPPVSALPLSRPIVHRQPCCSSATAHLKRFRPSLSAVFSWRNQISSVVEKIMGLGTLRALGITPFFFLFCAGEE